MTQSIDKIVGGEGTGNISQEQAEAMQKEVQKLSPKDKLKLQINVLQQYLSNAKQYLKEKFGKDDRNKAYTPDKIMPYNAKPALAYR